MTNEEQHIMLRVKSLLYQLSYIIKEEHKEIVDDFHTLCRKYCSWGKPEKPKGKMIREDKNEPN